MDNGSTLSADEYIITAGYESIFLLKNIGIRVPLYPLKGYSIQF